MGKITNIDDYIAGFPEHTGKLLLQMREIIRQAAPDADEVISYQMPAFKQKGILVYYAAYKNHIGFYPMANAIEEFKSELSPYKWTKGTIQFPLDQPLPVELITRIIEFRVSSRLKNKK
jgi:uncharacterized protein YdhG (YjbR/CyaY superfamily)